MPTPLTASPKESVNSLILTEEFFKISNSEALYFLANSSSLKLCCV